MLKKKGSAKAARQVFQEYLKEKKTTELAQGFILF